MISLSGKVAIKGVIVLQPVVSITINKMMVVEFVLFSLVEHSDDAITFPLFLIISINQLADNAAE